jgi:1-acyl-sn-glycerol-3-phosphate acyltransferase
MVRACVNEFAKREKISFTITPEGTRGKVKEWKLGFYYIATEARVPIVPVALDYPNRLVRIMEPFVPTGDVAVDLPRIKALYSPSMARHPENF